MPRMRPRRSSASSRADSLAASSARAPLCSSSTTVGDIRAGPLRMTFERLRPSFSFDLMRQLLGLVLLVERRDELVQVAVHHVVELVEREVDAMVGDAALRKIVGADALGA